MLHSMDGQLDKRAAVLHAVSAGATGAAGLDEEFDMAEDAAAAADLRPDFDELAPEEARVSAEEEEEEAFEEEDGIGGTTTQSILLLLRAQLLQHPLRGATRMAAGLEAPTSPLDNVSLR